MITVGTRVVILTANRQTRQTEGRDVATVKEINGGRYTLTIGGVQLPDPYTASQIAPLNPNRS